jgi:CubicO group peptidase (beta-lactamase class C family)
MKHTRFDDKPTELIPDRVLGYSPQGSGFVLNTNASNGVTGDGALFTTVEDLSEWDRYLYLSGSHSEELFTGTALKDGTAVPYGFGFSLGRFLGYRLIAHGGGFKGYRAEMFRFPEERLTVVCLCNTSGANPTSLVEKVSALYLGKKIAPPRPPTTPAKRESVAVSQEISRVMPACTTARISMRRTKCGSRKASLRFDASIRSSTRIRNRRIASGFPTTHFSSIWMRRDTRVGSR